jgi:hypothetical protein
MKEESVNTLNPPQLKEGISKMPKIKGEKSRFDVKGRERAIHSIGFIMGAIDNIDPEYLDESKLKKLHDLLDELLCHVSITSNKE